ncbi:MAG: hypothetical protein V2A66_08485 [Pseudomonadota bacterium]
MFGAGDTNKIGGQGQKELIASTPLDIHHGAPSDAPPSDIAPSAINGQRQYIAIVLDKSDAKEWKIVTTVFQPTPEKMRKSIAKYYLAQWKLKPQGITPPSDADFARVMGRVNAFLHLHGQKPLTVDALYGLDGLPDTAGKQNGKDQIRMTLEAKGFKGKDVNKEITKIEQTCETLGEALDYISKLGDAVGNGVQGGKSTKKAPTAAPSH